MCEGVQALEKSVNNLRTVNVSENGLSEFSSGLSQVKNDLDQVTSSAKTEYQPQLASVNAAVDDLSSSISAAKADPTGPTLRTVGVAVTAVGNAVTGLRQAVNDTC